MRKKERKKEQVNKQSKNEKEKKDGNTVLNKGGKKNSTLKVKNKVETERKKERCLNY